MMIIRHDTAQKDLADLAAHIARESRRAARRFLAAAEHAFTLLAQMPELGTPCEFQNPAAAGLRMWLIRGFENHVIFYRPTATGIEVIRVLHAARDLEAIFEEKRP